MAHGTVTIDLQRSALLLVDIQFDFLPGGALPVAGGDQILDPVRLLMTSGRLGVIVATQDWHPQGHASFASSHPGRKPFETILLHGHEQTLWPDHCVQGSPGAQLHPGLPWTMAAAIVRKGMEPACDSYSGFRNNWNAKGERPPTGLAGYLFERGVTELFVCGLARDYCVKWTAEDGVDAGFHVSVIWDLTRPVDPSSDQRVLEELSRRGVRIIMTDQMIEGQRSD
jgi:nicotinamidase/pyrazinamidase